MLAAAAREESKVSIGNVYDDDDVVEHVPNDRKMIVLLCLHWVSPWEWGGARCHHEAQQERHRIMMKQVIWYCFLKFSKVEFNLKWVWKTSTSLLRFLHAKADSTFPYVEMTSHKHCILAYHTQDNVNRVSDDLADDRLEFMTTIGCMTHENELCHFIMCDQGHRRKSGASISYSVQEPEQSRYPQQHSGHPCTFMINP